MVSGSREAPLILTLALDETSQRLFDDLRSRHFPPELNHLAAHLTLFHTLPGEELESVAAAASRIAEQSRATIALDVGGLRFLGFGVAYDIRSPALDRLRQELAELWAAWLTPQDRQPFRPHVTVQNKVTAAEAKALHAELAASFQPFSAEGLGLALWRYRSGPWEPAGSFPFTGEH